MTMKNAACEPSPRLSARRDRRRGMLDALPVLIAAGPVGLLFGALAVAKGLTPLDAVLMSATVYAGASQMVAIDLFEARVPAVAIVLSVFAVNFRHILYSAAMTPMVRPLTARAKAGVFAVLIDPQFALAEKRMEEGRPFSLAWYFGLAATTYAMWVATALIGALFGRLIRDPDALALDMLFPIYFLALVMGFRKRAGWWPVVAVSAAVSSLVFHAPHLGVDGLGSPWHVSLGALAGVATAGMLAGEDAAGKGVAGKDAAGEDVAGEDAP